MMKYLLFFNLKIYLACLQFPADHQRYIPATNLIDQALVEENLNFRPIRKFNYFNAAC
jgi:hypothetical protein